MSYYKRVLYMDCYENGIKLSNAGFVKLLRIRKKEGMHQKTCMQIYILNLPWTEYWQGNITFEKNSCKAVLGSVDIYNGKGLFQIKDVEEVLGNFEDWESGALEIQLTADRILLCEFGETESRENDEDVSGQEKEGPQKENMSADCEAAELEAAEEAKMFIGSETVKEENGCRHLEHEEAENKKKYPERRMKRDKWEELWEILPHVNPFGDKREYLKLQLQDLLILPKKYYRLAENSFLLHGYYNYDHLILTKICWKGSEKYMIGVPGNYYERETQVAVWFGFESFEPKAEPASDGDYGYYMISVEI